jgi:hypothetical protein
LLCGQVSDPNKWKPPLLNELLILLQRMSSIRWAGFLVAGPRTMLLRVIAMMAGTETRPTRFFQLLSVGPVSVPAKNKRGRDGPLATIREN